jgi:hypothetical protein
MASTGNVFPTTAANVDRAAATAWTNPGNVVSDNATDATNALTAQADYLVTSAYGFSIPTNATIIGVTVRVEASESGGGDSSYIPQLHSATTPTLIGSAKGAVTVSGTTKVISTNGGVSDLWGATLTPAIVNAAGFGVTIWSTDTGNTLAIDYVTIAIEYSLPTDDGDVSWWAGTNLSGAGVAIAGAAAALATSVAIAGGFNFNDEIATASAADLGVGGTSVAAPAPNQDPRLLYWHQADDLPVAAAPSPVLQEGEWQPPFALTPGPVPLAAWDDAALPVAVVASVPLDDEQAWQAPWVIAPTVTPLVWITGDELGAAEVVSSGGGGLLREPVRLHRWYGDDSLPVAATPLPVDLEYWIRPPVQPPVRDLRLWTSTDERETVPAALQVEDDSTAPLRTQPADATSVVWAENDDFPQQSAGAATRFEDEAFNPAPKIAGVNGIVWAADEDLPSSAPTIALDDTYWHKPATAVIPPATLALVDPDVPLVSRPVDDYWQQPFSVRVDPAVRVWLEQDERETVPAALQVDENEWARPFSITPPRDLRLWTSTDERETVPAPLQVEDESLAVLRARLVDATSVVWAENDDFPQQGAAATRFEDDAFSPAPKLVEVNGILWATDEDLPGAAAPTVALDDTHWHKLPTALVAPTTLTLVDPDVPVVSRPVEDYWVKPFSITPEPVARVWVEQDEREVVPDPLQVVDNEWNPPITDLPGPYLRVWGSEDLPELVAPVVEPEPEPPVFGGGSTGEQRKKWKKKPTPTAKPVLGSDKPVSLESAPKPVRTNNDDELVIMQLTNLVAQGVFDG